MDVYKTLCLDICVIKHNENKKFPLYIQNTFAVDRVKINGIDCIMLIPYDDLPTISNFHKQIEKIKSTEDMPVFLKLEYLSNFRKENLISNHIPFILKKELAYLPFLGAVLTNRNLDTTMVKPDQFMLSTQLLFIWILYKQENKIYIMDAIEQLPFSNMTMTRAYRQLVNCGLFSEHKDGWKIYLTTKFRRQELFEKAKTYFISPILHFGYVNKDEYISEMVESGETALSTHTMINSSLPKTYALCKEYKNLITLENELINVSEQIKVEVWKYDPLMFSKDKKNIDPYSLMISLLENMDERVETAIKELFKKI